MKSIVRDACAKLIRHSFHDALPETSRTGRGRGGESHAIIFDTDYSIGAFVLRLQIELE